VTSERRVAANRRNSRKSTGPRSGAGRQRASRNAYRHGLSATVNYAAVQREVDQLARSIVGQTNRPTLLAYARSAAAAVLELSRVREVKAAMIERVAALLPVAETAEIKALGREVFYSKARARAADRINRCRRGQTHSVHERSRYAEALRLALPELLKLDRYERRAAARRDRAIRRLHQRRCRSEPLDVT
jgi:hypothetical protein